MTTLNKVQSLPLDPVPTGIKILFPGDIVSPMWNKWFVDMREKVNVINATLAAWSGITPVTGLTPGTYGDTTHYPIVSVNEYGMITEIVPQAFSGGGGSPMHITTVATSYVVTSADIPKESSYIGMIVQNSSNANTVILDLFSNTNIPVGADLWVLQNNTGDTTIAGKAGTTLVGPSITGGGRWATGKATQISQDIWAISGDLAFMQSGADPYWANVISLLHFDGTDGSTTISDEVSGNTWTAFGTTSLTTSRFKFGTASANWPSASTSNKISGPSNLSPFAGDFTIEFWVYPITNSSSYTACFFGVDRTSGPRGFQVNWLSDNTVNVLVVNGPSVVSSNTLTLNAWNYIGFSVSGTSAVLNLAGTLTTGTWVVGSGNVTNSLTFGTHVDGVTDFIGSIDEFRLTRGIGRDISTVPTAPFPNF